MSFLFLGCLLASFKALESIYSICPLVLLNSSEAHFSMAFSCCSSSLKAKAFFLLITILQRFHKFRNNGDQFRVKRSLRLVVSFCILQIFTLYFAKNMVHLLKNNNF